jgi:hypothetical protein
MTPPLWLFLGLLPRCGDSFHLQWMARESAIPPARFESIARVETACNLSPRVRGHHCPNRRDCEVGRFQIKPSTARRRCAELNVWTYRGNTECALRILDENVREMGLVETTRRFNGAGPATYEYFWKVLKTEESL